MDIFSKHITDREKKHCGCGERGSHGAYTGNGYEDYRGYGDRTGYGSQAECSSCAIFNGLNEGRSSCGCGSSNNYNDSRIFEANRGCGSCSCDSNRGGGSCSCDSNRGGGSCSCDTSPSYSSCSCDTSPSYNSCSCDTSPSYGSCSCDTYEESGCCDTYKESRGCGSCSTYGNDNYGSCNPCAERKSCDSGGSDSCGCVNPSCGIYVHCDSCGYYEPKGCDNHGRSECSCKDPQSSNGNDCGCGCQNEPRSCGCASYDSYSESCCNVCHAPRASCECGSYRASSQSSSCSCKGRDGGRKGSSEEFSLGFNSFAGFSSQLGVKCYEKLQGKPKKCRKRGKLRCRCKTDMIQRGICDIKKGLELSQKGYKEICCNSFYEGEQSLCAAIEVIRKGLIDFNKGLPDVQPCVTCDGWRILYMGVCHIDAGLKELCKGNKELSKHCYDKCSTEEIKKGICSLEEGLKKFTKALIDILY